MSDINKLFPDINDDEIRVISSRSKESTPGKTALKEPSLKEKTSESLYRPERSHYDKRNFLSRNKIWIIILFLLVILAAISAFVFFTANEDSEEEYDYIILQETSAPAPTMENIDTKDEAEPDNAVQGYVGISDTVVGKTPLSIFVPRYSTPRLHIGADALSDSSAVMVVQAADIRADNGEIVGAYVLEGELKSRGKSKSGFCAIINGKPIVGVADATPYMEQAIETDGYFFRQYPLVVGGQMVDNKLKTSSLRKALAELNGEIVVVMSHKKMTLNEFAQTLVDLGVSNAIYLVGSTAYGFANDESGHRVEFGKEQGNPAENANYIVWE